MCLYIYTQTCIYYQEPVRRGWITHWPWFKRAFKIMELDTNSHVSSQELDVTRNSITPAFQDISTCIDNLILDWITKQLYNLTEPQFLLVFFYTDTLDPFFLAACFFQRWPIFFSPPKAWDELPGKDEEEEEKNEEAPFFIDIGLGGRLLLPWSWEFFCVFFSRRFAIVKMYRGDFLEMSATTSFPLKMAFDLYIYIYFNPGICK